MSEDANDYVKVDSGRYRSLPEILRTCRKKYQDRTVTEMDAEKTGFQRHPSDQQHCRYHKLCDGRIRPADACL